MILLEPTSHSAQTPHPSPTAGAFIEDSAARTSQELDLRRSPVAQASRETPPAILLAACSHMALVGSLLPQPTAQYQPGAPGYRAGASM